MPRVMRFIVDEQPEGSKINIAIERLFGLTDPDANIVEVGKRKNQLLAEEDMTNGYRMRFVPTSENCFDAPAET